jgi:hypothetical protein
MRASFGGWMYGLKPVHPPRADPVFRPLRGLERRGSIFTPGLCAWGYRLLPATRAGRSGRCAGCEFASAAEVDEVDVAHGLAQEARAQALELFD